MFLLPIEEHNPRRNPSYAVWFLIAANVGAFMLAGISGFDQVLQDYGFRPAAPSIQTVVSSMFLHAGPWHLISNMFFLLMFGDNVEDMTGAVKFLLAYLLAGVAAGEMYAFTADRPEATLVGASGAVSGVVGMYLVLFPRVSFHTHVILLWFRLGGFRSSAAVATGSWFGQQLLLAGLSSWIGSPILGVAFWAHVGGFGAGIVLGFMFGRLACAWTDEHTLSRLERS